MTAYLGRNGIKIGLAFIAINAIIGIVSIVSGDFSALDAKILVTSLSVTGGAVLALANLVSRSDRFIVGVPEVGAIASIAGFGLLIGAIWSEFSSETVARSAGTFILVAVGTAHAGLLSLSRLETRYLPVLRAAWLLATVLVVMIAVLIWFSDSVDDDIYQRAMGVVIILVAAATLAIPVLHRASRDAVAREVGMEAASRHAENAVRYCPSCGSPEIEEADGSLICRTCGALFNVEFGVDALNR